jgi:hypothetical protein
MTLPRSLLLSFGATALATAVLLGGCAPDIGPAGPSRRDGDGGAGATDDGAIATVTYHADVRPILARHCEGCHVAGGIAPFPLDTYDIARTTSLQIASATRARRMPPYPANASGDCNTFHDARWLSEQEIATLEAWHVAGAPEGIPVAAPERMASPTFAPGEATHRVELASPYLPAPSDDDTPLDTIRCFVVDPGLASPGFLTAYQVVPGEPRVVHHAILFEPETAASAEAAIALDAADAEPGYDCNGGPSVAAHPVVLWAPGGGALHFPSGTGLRIGTHPMVMQIHYNLGSGALPDQTRIDLVIVPSVDREARILALADPAALELAPRSESTSATAEVLAPASGLVWGVSPHMHQRGRTLRVTRDGAGPEQCMLDVDRWDFAWQLGYFYETPIAVARGDRLTLKCVYDTRSDTGVVTWGEGTGDEMCLAYFYVTAS